MLKLSNVVIKYASGASAERSEARARKIF